MAIDPKELPRALGHFATGVTVMTCRGGDEAPHGATVNAFTAVSLEPPLVLVSLDRRSKVCSLQRPRAAPEPQHEVRRVSRKGGPASIERRRW